MLICHGHGCNKCSRENNGWTRLKFKNHCNKNNNGIGTFYILKCFNENETFYKIGITSKSVQERYKTLLAMPYNYEITQQITGDPLLIWDLEYFLKKYNKQYRYMPLQTFPGCITECFIFK